MGLVRQVAIIIASISLFTFIALFGALPRLRETPIGWAYRFLRYTIPRWLSKVDLWLCGGRCTAMSKRFGHYVMYERHPLILVFYLTLITGGTYMFIDGAWSYLTSFERIIVILAIPTPYLTLYLAANANPGIITPSNNRTALTHYPYDHINFFPSHICRTCHLPKPARSKHCSICRACVGRQDHHCVWLNTCVGQLNTRWFLLFLITTNLFLTLGTYLSFLCICRVAEHQQMPMAGLDRKTQITIFGIVLVDQTYTGAVFLLASICGVLSYAFTIYHAYLIWAGTTTNETAKWADWKDDIQDGIVFIADMDTESDASSTSSNTDNLPTSSRSRRRKRSSRTKKNKARGARPSEEEDATDELSNWPRKSEQKVMRIDDGEGPETLPRGWLWRRVEKLEEIENIYDLGGWRNLLDVVFPKKL
ncbi:zf-DHHC-domain-containing protein [Ascodesmis nigricans]|uniref:Palmitoyltransferase n=1 Tax=Ascodesmis nigricans TaxID=341454 RepID=A0A4S2MSV5_9PEZI|nr:zf-DHHC-domain-containing protein [Ascodesmis nigricans]